MVVCVLGHPTEKLPGARGGQSQSTTLRALASFGLQVTRLSALGWGFRSALRPGDLVLLEGAGQQHFDRIRLALTGRTVRCDIQVCTAWMRCGDCPMLEPGWDTAEGMPVRSRS